MNTLRFRPAHVRVAASRSTWCRRIPHHPTAPTTTGPPGSRVAAATPASRSFVLASLRALHLDPRAPTPAQPAAKPRPTRRAQHHPDPATPRVDKPFHIRLPAGIRCSRCIRAGDGRTDDGTVDRSRPACAADRAARVRTVVIRSRPWPRRAPRLQCGWRRAGCRLARKGWRGRSRCSRRPCARPRRS